MSSGIASTPLATLRLRWIPALASALVLALGMGAVAPPPPALQLRTMQLVAVPEVWSWKKIPPASEWSL